MNFAKILIDNVTLVDYFISFKQVRKGAGNLLKKDLLNNLSDPEPVFRRAVVAAAFSPRLNAVLNEAHRFASLLGTWPIIVHVGEENSSIRTRLEEEIDRSAFKKHPPVCLVRSGNPADVLIEAAREYDADLIIAGALKKEGLFKYYLGSVARKIARYAPCSVLLMPDPKSKPDELNKIHCVVEYDDEAKSAIEVADRIGHAAGSKDLYFTHSFRIPDMNGQKEELHPTQFKEFYHAEDEKLKLFLKEFKFWCSDYSTRCLLEKSRTSTLDFTRELKADLFVVPGSSSHMGFWDRLFPQGIELALQNLPCSLLVSRYSSF